jgi:hypothetical protein
VFRLNKSMHPRWYYEKLIPEPSDDVTVLRIPEAVIVEPPNVELLMLALLTNHDDSRLLVHVGTPYLIDDA